MLEPSGAAGQPTPSNGLGKSPLGGARGARALPVLIDPTNLVCCSTKLVHTSIALRTDLLRIVPYQGGSDESG